MAFIDLTNVEIVDEVSEDAKVLVEENGEIKRTGMAKSNNDPYAEYDLVVVGINGGRSNIIKGSYQDFFDKFRTGIIPKVLLVKTYDDLGDDYELTLENIGANEDFDMFEIYTSYYQVYGNGIYYDQAREHCYLYLTVDGATFSTTD